MKQIIRDCKITPAAFVDDNGKKIEYLRVVVVLDGEEISLFVKDKDKSLFSYLVKKEFDNSDDYEDM